MFFYKSICFPTMFMSNQLKQLLLIVFWSNHRGLLTASFRHLGFLIGEHMLIRVYWGLSFVLPLWDRVTICRSTTGEKKHEKKHSQISRLSSEGYHFILIWNINEFKDQQCLYSKGQPDLLVEKLFDFHAMYHNSRYRQLRNVISNIQVIIMLSYNVLIGIFI